ncbi:MAG TPA: VOC family protein [Bryobacteraceae bacterium]|nr:VOC family protein [Bryobacteraceae bacterium]
MFRGLHHFNLIVSDKERTKAFYHGLLGLEIALETEIEDDEFSRGVGLPGTKVLATFFKLPNNNGLIETFQYVRPPGTPVPADNAANSGGWQHLCFQVDDIEKTQQQLAAKGIKFLSSPVTIASTHPVFAGVRFCYFLGPDREVLEILQA